jgi:hypothetical protein
MSSLSVLASSETSDAEESPALWWPSLLFNDYHDFQDFFADEFNESSNLEDNKSRDIDDASETKGLIVSRMIQNMCQQKSIMVARLLGRSIKEYVEIIELPVEDDGAEDKGKSDAHDLVEPHQATEFVSFIRMPQEVHLAQMKPEAFIAVASSNTSEEATKIIDDDLYMSYMYALDLVSTKRMSGPKAPNDTLRSAFRDIGRVELERLPPSVQRLSGTSASGTVISSIPNATEEILKQQEPNEGEENPEEDSDDSGSDEDTDIESTSQDDQPPSEELTDSSSPEAPLLENTDAELITPAANSPEDNTSSDQAESKESVVDSNGDSEEQANTGDEKADVNDPSSLTESSSATVVSQSSEGPDTSPATAPIASPLPKKKRGLSKKKVPVNTPIKTSKRVRSPKKISDLPETESLATVLTSTPLNCPSPKKKRRPKRKADLSETTSKESDTGTEPFVTFPSTPKKKRRGRPKQKADSPNVLDNEEEFYIFRNLMKYLTKKCSWKYLPAKIHTWQYVLPGRPKERNGGKHLEDLFFKEEEVIQYCKDHCYFERRHELAKDGSPGGDATVVETSSPDRSPETRAVTIASTPSPSTQKLIDLDDPGIGPDDSLDEVCTKLEYVGWTVDNFGYNYFSPEVGYDDIKMNPQWRGKKFFLGREDFLVFLRETYGWTMKKTPKKRVRRGSSNAVTPNLSSRPKRSRRSPSRCEDDNNDSQFNFKSEEEEEFYCFPNLMRDLKNKCGWGYVKAKIHPWHYVLPGCPTEQKGGKHLEDYFFDESEVILYCMNRNYFERRHELGLVED